MKQLIIKLIELEKKLRQCEELAEAIKLRAKLIEGVKP